MERAGGGRGQRREGKGGRESGQQWGRNVTPAASTATGTGARKRGGERQWVLVEGRRSGGAGRRRERGVVRGIHARRGHQEGTGEEGAVPCHIPGVFGSPWEHRGILPALLLALCLLLKLCLCPFLLCLLFLQAKLWRPCQGLCCIWVGGQEEGEGAGGEPLKDCQLEGGGGVGGGGLRRRHRKERGEKRDRSDEEGARFGRSEDRKRRDEAKKRNDEE